MLESGGGPAGGGEEGAGRAAVTPARLCIGAGKPWRCSERRAGRGSRQPSRLGEGGREGGFPRPRERAAARAWPRAHLRFFRNMPSGAPLSTVRLDLGSRLGSGPAASCSLSLGQILSGDLAASWRLPCGGSLEFPAPMGFCRTVGRQTGVNTENAAGGHSGRCCSAAVEELPDPGAKEQQNGFCAVYGIMGQIMSLKPTQS